MRMSRLLAPTLKEAPKEAEVPSHRLLLRAGFIRKLAAGIYDFLPLAMRSLSKISAIVREELSRAGAQEVLLPMVQPAELWNESGRWEQYGAELLRLTDRKEAPFCLGPTHEEVIVDLVRRDVNSYKQLPVNLFQIQAKFRDEIRPRAGLMRGREFLMKDGYSFDASDADAIRSYEAMRAAYCEIFKRCGLNFRVVDADSGNIGGSLSQEFQVLATTGEDRIVACDSCEYSANVEKAELRAGSIDGSSVVNAPTISKIATPKVRSVAEVAAFLGTESSTIAKTLIYQADDRLIAVVLRGDREANEVKIRNACGAVALELANEATVQRVTGAPVGFAGPVGLSTTISILVDHEICVSGPWVVGANEADAHYAGAVWGRDFFSPEPADLRMATDGDPCPRCGAGLAEYRGIEVGHVFFLGTKYSAPMKCTFLDEHGKAKPMVMGCYGIGVSRVLAAAVEQHHDDAGIKWPLPIAPFEAVVISMNPNDSEVEMEALRVYEQLRALGVDVLFDDRAERAGVKLKDSELIGHPCAIVVGRKGLDAGAIEVRYRGTGAVEHIPVAAAVQAVHSWVQEGRRVGVGQ